jgi:hypothetical protein
MALVLNNGKILLNGDSQGYYTKDENGKLVYHPSALQELMEEQAKEREERRRNFMG